MTATEKKLQRRIDLLESRIEMLMDRMGIRDEALDDLRYQEALDALHERGDRKPLDEYFKAKNRQHVA